MNADAARLRRWLRRAQPPRDQLLRALLAGLLATSTNVALFVGALALLVESANRPGLRAVAAVLIVIELFAFLRSPLRFYERLSAHRLGYAAVTRWRRWLVVTIGRLNFSQWRAYAAGDLLERALRDTDELQDLWLRCVVPLVDTAAVLLLADVVVGLLPPHGGWWPYAANLAVLQVVGFAGLALVARAELESDRALRAARGHYRAQVVELSAATPELALLNRVAVVVARSFDAATRLEAAERRLRRARRASSAITIVVALLALAGVTSHPFTSSVWLVVAATIGLVTYDSLLTVRSAFQAAVEVSGGGERLEALERSRRAGSRPWPDDATLRLSKASVQEDGRVLVREATLDISPGTRVALTGESGVGKSTLLRAMGALDELAGGAITVGSIALDELDETELRRHLLYVPAEPGFTRGFALDVVTLGRPTARDPGEDLASLGLIVDRATRFDELSRGERARVAMARALVTSPAIYLLDEPTAGLGRDETRQVLATLTEMGSTVVVATHDEEVISWCDVVVELRNTELMPVSR